MSYPDPMQSPDAFCDHLKSLELNIAQIVFGHYQVRPSESNGRFDELATLEWCERMDLLLAKFSRIAAQQPDHQDIVAAIKNICADAVATIESKVEAQKQSDAIEAMRLEEEAKRRLEEEKSRALDERLKRGADGLLRDREKLAVARERLAETSRIAEQQMAIIAAKRDLEAKEKALSDAQRSAAIEEKSAAIEVDDADDDDRSDSAPEEQQETTKKKTMRQKEESRKRMPQVTHEILCQNCARTNETVCSGPTGQACDGCWKMKKSCSNGGQRRPREMTIKEEPKSPGRVTTRKRKAYSTTDANPIGVIEPIDDADTDPIQPAGKRAKTASASTSHVRFDGVAVPKATRKSTRVPKASSKKELFARLGKEFASISKTCEELSETMD